MRRGATGPPIAEGSLAGHSPARPPGRPRSARAHWAIVDAAIELFVEQGYDAMSMEGIAARARVGKTTIYRRWSSKEDLLVDAIAELIADVQPPDTGSLREDLVDVLVKIQGIMTSSPAGDVFPRMAAHVAVGSPLGRAYLSRVIAPRFVMVEAILARGVARRELPLGLDAELARDMLLGPVIVAKLSQRLTRRGSRDRAERIVDSLLGGLRAPRGGIAR